MDEISEERTGRLRRLLPPAGPERTLALGTFVNTIGNGMLLTTSAVYFTQVVGLSPAQVGLGLTLAGAAGLAVSTPMGHVADVLGPRELMVWTTLVLGVLSLGYLFVGSFVGFVIVAVVLTLLDGASRAARGAVLASVGREGGRVRLRAYLRAVTNVGITLGGIVGGLALAVDRPGAYRAMIVLDALTFVLAGLIARRLPHVPPVPHSGEGPRLVVLRDRPYVALTALNAVMTLHFGLLEVALPLWVIQRTEAPKWAIAVVVLVNTVCVVLLQVRMSRGVSTVRQGADATRRSGLVLAVACVVLAASGWGGPAVAVALLLAGSLVQVLGEMLQSAGSWALGFGLAPDDAQGQYQGLYSTGFALSSMLSPALLTTLVVVGGPAGWAVLAVLFAGSGFLAGPLARWALRTPPGPGLTRSEAATPA